MNPPFGPFASFRASGPRPEVVCVVMSVFKPFVNVGGTWFGAGKSADLG